MTPPPPAVGVLGRSGLAVTRIGLGLAAAGRPGYINVGHHDDLAAGTGVDAMEAAAHALLDAAFAGGIRYLDAARSYGRAEQFLASWLDRRAPAARRGDSRVEVGLHVHGGLARRCRRSTR